MEECNWGGHAKRKLIGLTLKRCYSQYGPWDTTEGGHMRVLGPILLAIALRAEQEGKEEESEN